LYSLVVEQTEDGEPLRRLIVETWRGASTIEDSRSEAIHPQTLSEHQSWAQNKARLIADALGLLGDHAEALMVAALLHDEGKKAWRWQRAFKAPAGGEPFAKTRGPINFALLANYRHEFGSLPYAAGNERFGRLPPELQELVLHLIAAHHGYARPVIGTNGCEDLPPSALKERACQVALRFANLQKQGGPWGLAWWEALLRAADQQASRDNDRRREKAGQA
jgi:CRISPR-associated endonuclease/helicase Cas3